MKPMLHFYLMLFGMALFLIGGNKCVEIENLTVPGDYSIEYMVFMNVSLVGVCFSGIQWTEVYKHGMATVKSIQHEREIMIARM